VNFGPQNFWKESEMNDEFETDDDIDRGMEMLGGVMLTLILAAIVLLIGAVAGWLR
jgi:hypothetical protein